MGHGLLKKVNFYFIFSEKLILINSWDLKERYGSPDGLDVFNIDGVDVSLF